MRVAIFDRVEPPAPVELPCRLTATCSHRAAAVLLVLVAPAVLVIGFGAAMVLVQAAYIPGSRAVLAQHPALGFEVVAAIAFFACLLGLPIKRLFGRLTLSRDVEIDCTVVTVTERNRFRTKIWTQPLSSYAGLAHHVRASVSGTRHELILVHPEWEKSVLVSLAARMPQTEVDRVAQLFRQQEIPASALYRLRVQWPRLAALTWRDPAHA